MALFLGVFAVAAVVGGVVAGLVGTVSHAADEGVRSTLARQPDELRTFVVSVRADGADAGGAVAAAIDEAFAGLPVAVDEGTDDDGRPRWVIAPRPDEVDSAGLGPLLTAWARLDRSLEGDSAQIGHASLSGGFPRTAASLERSLQALGTSLPLGILSLVVAAALTVWELAGLIARGRLGENTLLLDRGATRAGLAGSAAIEGATTAFAGAFVGALAGAAIAPAAGVAPASGITVLAATAGVAAIFALRTARSLRGGGTARRRSWGPLLAAGVVAAAAGVAVWQLRSRGLVTTTTAGIATTDPLAVAVPALVLLATALLSLAVLPVVTRAIERRLAAGDGTALAIRSVGRRMALAAAPIVAVTLAAGQLGFAAAYAATWRETFDATQEVRAGAPLTALALAGGLDDTTLAAIGAVPGVDGVAPVRETSVSLGGIRTSVSGVAPAALRSLAGRAGGAVDPSSLADAIEVGERMPPVPEAATDLSVELEGAPAEVGVWLADDWGAVAFVALAPNRGIWQAALPATPHPPWRVVAADVQAAGGAPETLSIRRMATDAGDVGLAPRWQAVAFHPWGDDRREPGPDPEIVTEGIPGLIRLIVSPEEPAIVLSDPLARAADVLPGPPVRLAFGSEVEAQALVATTAVGVPGAADPSAVLMDARTALALSLIASSVPPPAAEAWIAAAQPTAAAEALRASLPAGIAVESVADDPVARMMATGPAVITAAAGAGVALAIAALGAACAAQTGLRRDEIDTLAALGMTAAAQAAARRREMWLLTAWGMLAGVVAASLLVIAPVASLARAAVTDPYPDLATRVRLDAPLLAGGLVVLVGGLVTVVLVYGAGVGRSARTAPRAEAR